VKINTFQIKLCPEKKKNSYKIFFFLQKSKIYSTVPDCRLQQQQLQQLR
jgi:hypothetical protein